MALDPRSAPRAEADGSAGRSVCDQSAFIRETAILRSINVKLRLACRLLGNRIRRRRLS
jgi:hypothetical protein